MSGTLRRTLSGLLYLAWATLTVACAEDKRLQQTVTFQEPAQSLKSVCQKLSRSTGVVLFPVPPLDKEIVLVDAANLPLKALMDALAHALDAEWSAQPNGAYRLSRPPKRALERRQKDDAAIADAFRRAMEQELKQSEQQAWTREALQQSLQEAAALLRAMTTGEQIGFAERRRLVLQGRALNPVSRLVMRLLLRMDPKQLTNIPVGEVRVFSNRQGRFLTPFGFDVSPLLQQYAQEQNLLSVAWHDSQVGIAQAEQDYCQKHSRPESPLTLSWGDLPNTKPLSAASLSVYLSVGRVAGDAFSVDATVVDTATGSVYTYGEYFPLPTEASQPLPKGAWRQQPMHWSEESRLLAQAASSFSATFYTLEGDQPPYVLTQAHQRVVDPALVEPHSTITTDLLRSYARAISKPLVALTMDRTLTEYAIDPNLKGMIISGRDKLEQHIRFLQAYEWNEVSSVLVAKPVYASYAWGDRFDRAGVSRVSARVLQRGYATLNDRLEWAQVEAPYTDDCGARWAALRGATQFMYTAPHAVERMLNRLPARERETLLKGDPIRLDKASPLLREEIIRLVYRVDGATVRKAVPLAYNGEINPEANARRIPNAVFPDGIPLDSTVQLLVGEIAVYIPQCSGYLVAQTEPLWELLEGLSDAEKRARAEATVALFGLERIYTLEVRLPDEETIIQVGGSGIREFRPLHEKPVRWRELPADVRQQLEASVRGETPATDSP
ncbi:MAG: hypothetical protein RMK45_08590 [Armatimonadota bacterium]|nr:hypothetical protein [Armatimonadota bacterium]